MTPGARAWNEFFFHFWFYLFVFPVLSHVLLLLKAVLIRMNEICFSLNYEEFSLLIYCFFFLEQTLSYKYADIISKFCTHEIN